MKKSCDNCYYENHDKSLTPCRWCIISWMNDEMNWRVKEIWPIKKNHYDYRVNVEQISGNIMVKKLLTIWQSIQLCVYGADKNIWYDSFILNHMRWLAHELSRILWVYIHKFYYDARTYQERTSRINYTKYYRGRKPWMITLPFFVKYVKNGTNGIS